MNFAFKCKFCGKPGVVTGDDAGLEIIKPEKWIPNICCNRCGDYMVRKRKNQTAIFNLCRSLETSRFNLRGEKLNDMENRVRERLVDATKALCSIVCNYYRTTTVWDQEFPAMLMDKPDKAGVVIGVYIRSVAKEAKKPFQPLTHETQALEL